MLEVLLQLRNSDHLGDAWNLELCEFVLKGASGVLREDTDSSVVFLDITLEWVRDLDLKWARSGSVWHLCESEEHLQKLILIFEEVLSLGGTKLSLLLVILLQSLNCLHNLLSLY